MKWQGRSFLLGVAAALALPCVAQTPTQPFQNPALPAQERIANLLSVMTVDEKIDCLGTHTAVPRLGIPDAGSSEGIHGVVQRGGNKGLEAIHTTQFPQPVGMGETWDPDLVQEAAAIEGAEARFISDHAQYGRRILVLWGPQADLARDPRWGRSEEVYGEDPFLNGTMAVAFTKGLQRDTDGHWQSAALLKHFLANSNENYRSSSSSNFDERLFWEYYSVPFRMAFLEGGAKAVMASYNAWNGTPMAVNPVLQSIVEDKWGVDLLSTDGGAVKLLVTDHKRFATQKEAVVACIRAGINQFLDSYKDEVRAALQEHTLTEADLDAVLTKKFEVPLHLGLLDPAKPLPAGLVREEDEPWRSARDKGVSEQMALESVVLLKNQGALLPLDADTVKSIAVLGPLANSVHWDWYGGLPVHAVTPLEGIQKLVGSRAKIAFAGEQDGPEAVAAARAADVAIVVVGNDPTCGPNMGKEWGNFPGGGGTLPCPDAGDGREGRDRDSLSLAQEQLVKRVYAVNPRTVVVLVSSFPFTINWSQANVPAILHMAHASQDEGTALAKVLFGEYNPAGRLVTTWPESVEQLPAFTDYDIRHGRTYLYSKQMPLYEFGFGLSYTTFAYTDLKVEQISVPKTGDAAVSVTLENTGQRAGDEVVQLYVEHLDSKVSRPQKELKAFQRISLKPGERRSVRLSFPVSRLAYWNDATKSLEVEPETIRLWVGSSSQRLPLSAIVHVR